MKKYESKAQLAKSIGITRATLYRRSERWSIDINHLTDVGISEDDYQALTVDQSIGAVSSNSKQLKELAAAQAEVERLILENERIAKEKERIIDERSLIQNDNEKLQLRVQQLSDEKAALNKSYIAALEDAKTYADKFAQLADQSQRLQAQYAQKQLNEPKKGFWARVFGK